MLTVSEQFDDYGRQIVDGLRGYMVRAELAPSSETVPKKIREGTTRKIPNLLIIGEKERADGTVTVRRYGQGEQHTLPLETFERVLLNAIRERARQIDLSETG